MNVFLWLPHLDLFQNKESKFTLKFLDDIEFECYTKSNNCKINDLNQF